MNREEVQIESFQIIGIATRTTNSEEMGSHGKIPRLWEKFYKDQIVSKIPNKIDHDIVAIYYNYESDASGAYSVLIGQKVHANTEAPIGMVALNVPLGTYSKHNSLIGKMPMIVVDTWKKIWELTEKGVLQRKYTFDFELYDSRSRDPNSSQVDVFISV